MSEINNYDSNNYDPNPYDDVTIDEALAQIYDRVNDRTIRQIVTLLKKVIDGITGDISRYTIEKTTAESGEVTYKLMQQINNGTPTPVGDAVGLRGSQILANYDEELQILDNIINIIKVALDSKADAADIPTVPITAIKKNGTVIVPVDGTVNITVPIVAADVAALPDTTKYAAALSLTIDSATFIVTGQLKDQNGDNLGAAQTIDLPLESVVVGGSYNSQTQKVVLTLQNGNTIEFSVADLVYGLQTELSETNKLNPAYINYDSTHRAVSDTEKSEWNGKQDVIDSSHKLSADFIDDTGATNKFATEEELEQIETNKNNISFINSKISEIDETFLGKQNIALVAGYYISPDGTKVQNNDFEISNPILLTEGDIIAVKAQGYLTNVAILSITNESGSSYRPVIVSQDGVFKYYSYTVAESGYYCICTNVSAGAELYVNSNDEQINERVNILETEIGIVVENEYTPIESVGTIISNKNAQGNKVGTGAVLSDGDASYSVCEWIVEEGIQAVKIHCQASANTRYGVGFYCLTNNNKIVYQYNNPVTGTYDVSMAIPKGTYKIWANGLYGRTPTIETCTIQKVSKSYSKEEVDEKFTDVLPYTDVSLFSRIGVVGDSFACGELYFGGTYHDNYAISWGQVLARKHGITCTNYSSGGLHTRSWLTSSHGLPLLNNSPEDDLYLLVLGINDYYALGRDYLGSIEDITDYEDPENYGDTFYGNYGRIIEAIMTHAPHAKIVMVTINSQSELPVLFSNAIIEIATHYNIPYIVQHSDPFFESETYTDMAGSHPTAIGYSGMACAFERLIGRCMIDFHSYFRNAFMY